MRTLSSHSRRGGFTLVEVVIALVIFVFGALAIVRIFPPALGVIRNNESRVAATAIGETTLSQLQGSHSAPPEAVFDLDANSTQSNHWQDYAGAVVGTATKANSLPKSPTDAAYTASALGHFRYIYGEPHYIGPGQTVALNHPYDDTPNNVGTLNNLTFFLDDTIEGVQISNDGYLDFADATLESTGAAFRDTSDLVRPIRPPDTYRGSDFTYYLSYRWREYVSPGTPAVYTKVKGVIEEPLFIANETTFSDTTSARVLPCSVNSLNRVVAGGMKIRLRRKVTLTATGAIDLGSQRKIISIQNTGTVGATLYCSYLASDWRNITSDSSPTNNIVQLPINGIETSTVLGILTNSNKTTAAVLKSPDLSTPEKEKQARKGTIEFLTSSGTGARMRTVFQTLDGWAHQLSVAPRSYIPYNVARTGDNFPREPWREYHWQSSDDGMLYFHPSEAGKTVSVSFIDSSGVTVTSVNTIGEDLFDATTVGISTGTTGFAPSTKVARLEIADNAGNPPAGIASILSVQGMSVHARTAWQNGDRYNQVIVPGYRTLMQ